MQCKDIDETRILEFIRVNGTSTHFYANGKGSMPCVLDAMPVGVVEKLAAAKMSQMIKRGTVSGCCCGCRGDYEITEKGLERLNLSNESGEIE